MILESRSVGAIWFASLKKLPPDSEMFALAAVRLGLPMREQDNKGIHNDERDGRSNEEFVGFTG